MRKPVSIYIFLVFLLTAMGTDQSVMAIPVPQNPQDDYLIMNGKLWRNLYTSVKGNPYFMTAEYLHGDITFNGRIFRDKRFKYDIYNDEIVLWINSLTIIILNKEMVKEFVLNYQEDKFRVVNMEEDSTSILSGYVNIYYEGPTSLYVKYKKEIEILAVDDKYDLFIQNHRIFIRKDNRIVQVSGKRELLKLLSDRKAELKSFIKQNKLRVEKKEPRSFVPVLEYYDKLHQ